MPTHNAELHFAYPIFGNSLAGVVMNDRKGRFEDGQEITTSPVERFEGDLAFTKNTVYKLVNSNVDQIPMSQKLRNE